MDRIAELLQIGIAQLDAEQLLELHSAITEEFQRLREGELSLESVASMKELADRLDEVRKENSAREQAEAELAAEAEALAARVEPVPEIVAEGEKAETPPPPDGDGGGDGDDETKTEDDETKTEEAISEEKPEAEAEPAQEPLAAAAAVPARPSLASMRRAMPARRTPQPRSGARVLAAADIAGVGAGSEIRSARDLGDAIVTRWRSFNGRPGNGEMVPVASVLAEYPNERMLDNNSVMNMEKLAAISRSITQEAILASGGLCAPTAVRYDFMNVSEADRPVRDSLVRFGADRGGIRFLPPPVITDLDSAITLWTEANDQSPSNPATKPCLHVTCDPEQEVVVDAIVRCLEFGNFDYRTFSERVQVFLDLAMAAHARTAEQNLINTIDTGSTAVTLTQLFGATRDLLAELDRVAAAYRSRHRMSPAAPLRLMLPSWVINLISADLTREEPGATAERLATTQGQVQAFFATRNVNITWMWDAQVFGAQGAGAALGWPSTVTGYLFHEGGWLFLDGGTLDLGLVRDSTLNSTNDLQMFMETFEAAAFVGVESLKLTFDVCPSGLSSAGDNSIDPCTSGS